MKIKTLLLLLLVVTNCGTNVITKTYPIPTDVQPYVQVFETKYGQTVNNIQYNFAPLGYTDAKGGIVGECFDNSGVKSITLDPAFWSEADTTKRELLVLHELGHCVLLRDHLNSLQNDGMDTSIMNAYLMPEAYFKYQPDYYLTELMNTTNVPMLSKPSAGCSVSK